MRNGNDTRNVEGIDEYVDGHEHNPDDGSGWEPDYEVVCEADHGGY